MFIQNGHSTKPDKVRTNRGLVELLGVCSNCGNLTNSTDLFPHIVDSSIGVYSNVRRGGGFPRFRGQKEGYIYPPSTILLNLPPAHWKGEKPTRQTPWPDPLILPGRGLDLLTCHQEAGASLSGGIARTPAACASSVPLSPLSFTGVFPHLSSFQAVSKSKAFGGFCG
jgi:hypothetical protein